MYHYVNRLEGSITVSPERFDEHCRALARKGIRGIGLDEAEDFFIHGKPLPAKTFLFTFDDGYLDNYLHALPILARYGHRGVIFAVSNRLERGDSPRVPLKDLLAGTGAAVPEADFPALVRPDGITVRQDVFLNHAEARLAHASGVMALASHSRGHYGVFTGPEYTEFFRPRTRYRTFFRTELEPVWGLPDFPVRAGLRHRAFLLNPGLVGAVKNLVPQEFDAALAFFADAENVRALQALVDDFADNMGRPESDAERSERMWREIAGGKEELEAVLGQPVRTLCWPWGEHCDEAQKLALDAGFELFFSTSEGANPPARTTDVHRFKAKDKSGGWLANRIRLYSRPVIGNLYAKMRI